VKVAGGRFYKQASSGTACIKKKLVDEESFILGRRSREIMLGREKKDVVCFDGTWIGEG